MGFLSGLFGGGKKEKAPKPEPFKPVPQVDLQTTGYGGMGYTPVPQTFTPESMPSWMQEGDQVNQPGALPGQQQNWFAAPWWGKDAVTGKDLTQKDLMVQPQQAPQQQQQPQPQQSMFQSQPRRDARPLIGFGGGSEWGDVVNLADDYRSPFSYSDDELSQMFGW